MPIRKILGFIALVAVAFVTVFYFGHMAENLITPFILIALALLALGEILQ